MFKDTETTTIPVGKLLSLIKEHIEASAKAMVYERMVQTMSKTLAITELFLEQHCYDEYTAFLKGYMDDKDGDEEPATEEAQPEAETASDTIQGGDDQ